MAKNVKAIADLPVVYGGVSIGDATARLGIKCDRSWLQLDRADNLFCERRLSGRVVLGHHDDATGQKSLFKDADHKVEGTFDVKGYSVRPKHVSAGLTFALQEIDVSELALFSKGTGRLIVEESMEIPDDEEREEPEHIPGTLTSDEPWRDVPIGRLFGQRAGIQKSLKAIRIATVGELADYSAADKLLTDIQGIGPKASEIIESVLLDFYADNPQHEGGDT